MYNLFALIFLFLSTSFITTKSDTQKRILINGTINTDSLQTFTIKKENYTLNFKLGNEKEEQLYIEVSLVFKDGNSYLSKSKKEHFFMDLGDNINVEFYGNLESSDKVIPVCGSDKALSELNKVEIMTIYKQKLQLKTLHNFFVFGRMKFIVEPNHKVQEFPFKIEYKNGVYTVTQNVGC